MSWIDLISSSAPSIVNGVLQRRAAGSATDKLTGGVGRARDIATSSGDRLRRLYDDNYSRQLGLLDPYRKAGQADLDTIQNGLNNPGGEFQPYDQKFSFTGKDLENEPGYQFGLAEGQKAIDAARRAMGTRFSGGAVKEAIQYGNDYAGTKFQQGFDRSLSTFNSNENTFRQNQNDRFSRLKGIVDQGFSATGQVVNAAQDNTEGAARSELITSQQLQDLEAQKAEAEAAGDLGKAGAIQNTIEGMVKSGGVEQLAGLAKKALGVGGVPGAIPAVTGALVPGASAGAASLGGPVLGIEGFSAAAPTYTGTAALGAGSAAAGAPLTGYAGGGLVTSHGAMVGMLTNPITIAAAAGIIGVTALLKSQAHWEANTLVKTIQNPFGKELGRVVDGFDSAFRSGQLDKTTATQIRDEAAAAIQEFEKKLAAFETQGGKDNKKVAGQARRAMAQYFGPGWEKIIGKMDSEIAGLA